ncbi:MAG: hypothetical protein WCQ63_00345 [Methanomethylophilus sp.]|nr:hypothetical protein [Methanomethylophilus sp.]MDD4222346.1 hypothetical protein [Methanomethylophilus sp.]MDD4669209.1 hypothetical protein [Methanomethylophilus sp.]
MGLFSKPETVFERTDLELGLLNLQSPTGTGYDNILTFPFDVKPNRMLYADISADRPVDLVLANKDSSAAFHRENITALRIGPVPTGKNDNMGLILGIFQGDRAKVTIKIWMDRK